MVHCTKFVLKLSRNIFIVQCNMDVKGESSMAVSRTKSAKPVRKIKPVAAFAAKPAVKLGAVPKAVAAKATPVKSAIVAPVQVPVAPKPVAVAPKAAAPIAKRIETPVAPAAALQKDVKMTDTVKKIEDTVKATAAEAGEKATEMFKDMQDKAKVAFEKSGDMMKDVVEFHKANLEAVVESGKLAAKGSQTAMQNAVDYGKKNWETTAAHAKAISGVRAPADFVKMQSEYARGQFDTMVAEFTKSSEFTMKMMGEVMQPIQNRAAAVAEQMKTRMAA
jgi:hypothetical protein